MIDKSLRKATAERYGDLMCYLALEDEKEDKNDD